MSTGTNYFLYSTHSPCSTIILFRRRSVGNMERAKITRLPSTYRTSAGRLTFGNDGLCLYNGHAHTMGTPIQWARPYNDLVRLFHWYNHAGPVFEEWFYSSRPPGHGQQWIRPRTRTLDKVADGNGYTKNGLSTGRTTLEHSICAHLPLLGGRFR